MVGSGISRTFAWTTSRQTLTMIAPSILASSEQLRREGCSAGSRRKGRRARRLADHDQRALARAMMSSSLPSRPFPARPADRRTPSIGRGSIRAGCRTRPSGAGIHERPILLRVVLHRSLPAACLRSRFQRVVCHERGCPPAPPPRRVQLAALLEPPPDRAGPQPAGEADLAEGRQLGFTGAPGRGDIVSAIAGRCRARRCARRPRR
jgi:hypothetical protein